MPRAMLRLEFIGENYAAADELSQRKLAAQGVDKRTRDMLSMGVARPWVARLTGIDARFGFAREFQHGQKDYSQANGVGSRGVYLCYALTDGVYEVHDRVTWQRSRRYFVRVAGSTVTEIDREEVARCLNSESAS
ncbi:MAG: hypothetical protein IVW57_19200 [Ktedonobacterales bacterium]|nr:hypothetical protein [Ktedonobacterales bacterium]